MSTDRERLLDEISRLGQEIGGYGPLEPCDCPVCRKDLDLDYERGLTTAENQEHS